MIVTVATTAAATAILTVTIVGDIDMRTLTLRGWIVVLLLAFSMGLTPTPGAAEQNLWGPERDVIVNGELVTGQGLMLLDTLNEYIKGNSDIKTMTKTQKQLFTVRVFSVDEQGVPLPADSVKWWAQGERNHQHRFNCANAECTAWLGAVAIKLPVIIRADASRVKADDKHCSQLYASEQLYENNIADIRIILTPAGIVCR